MKEKNEKFKVSEAAEVLGISKQRLYRIAASKDHPLSKREEGYPVDLIFQEWFRRQMTAFQGIRHRRPAFLLTAEFSSDILHVSYFNVLQMNFGRDTDIYLPFHYWMKGMEDIFHLIRLMKVVNPYLLEDASVDRMMKPVIRLFERYALSDWKKEVEKIPPGCQTFYLLSYIQQKGDILHHHRDLMDAITITVIELFTRYIQLLNEDQCKTVMEESEIDELREILFRIIYDIPLEENLW